MSNLTDKLVVDNSNSSYIIVKAKSDNVQIIGMTRGNETKPHHTENLRAGESIVLQFTNKTSAIKIKGNYEIYCNYGKIEG